ncbi:hypothetical protein GCM10018965_082080 [Nonomuraea roseola]
MQWGGKVGFALTAAGSALAGLPWWTLLLGAGLGAFCYMADRVMRYRLSLSVIDKAGELDAAVLLATVWERSPQPRRAANRGRAARK